MSSLPVEFLRVPLAHRALHDISDGRPENSRAAILAAIEAGYGIEIDVQLSFDERAMVFHDYDLGRLTGTRGPIRQRRGDDLAQIALIGGEEGIPTLEEVLSLVNGQVPLLIELKDQDGAMGNSLGPLEAAVASAVKDYQGTAAVMSFNPNSVAELGRLMPDVPRGITTSSYDGAHWGLLPAPVRDHLREISDYDRVGASFISHEASDLTRHRVNELKSNGAAILCWTIKNEVEEAAARAYADNITFEGYLAAHPNH